MEPTKIKLYYFDLHGRAEAIRLVLYYNKVKYEDYRMSTIEWRELKKTGIAPYGKLPFVEIDGKIYAQSFSILRYFCQLYGQYPTDPLDILRVESIVAYVDDIRASFRPAAYWEAESEEKKQEVYNTYFEKTQPPHLLKLNSILKENEANGLFFFGKSLSIADYAILSFLSVFVFHDWRPPIVKESIAACPELVKYWETRKADFGDYFETRPKKFL
eukprot:TRINITY_DN15247_c0_g1_i1.p1 TRINITY_DN15247_c0_g1~~TRINITY_DN15247_c0_g1_i1.p1  ORF type:complete len:216 (+),score=42.21 TRINITY_DN15247_c0_g1_i1:160-807(+)